MKKTKKKPFPITLVILAGLILGILFGLFMPGRYEWALPWIELAGGIYMNALRMMIFPLVFCSLVVGIQGIGSVSATGRIGGQSLLYFTATTLFASLLGLFLPKMLGLGRGVVIEMSEVAVEATPFTSLFDTVRDLIPANPAAAFAEGNMLQVLVFAIIMGTACLSLGKKAEPFVRLAEAVNDISIRIVSVVMYFTPIGVFCSIAAVIYANGIETVAALGAVLAALYVTMFLYILLIYGGIVKVIGKCSVGTFFAEVMPAALNAFGTCSSSATLPISKQCADKLGVPNEISAFALPLGATINMDAVSIVMSFMIVFFANACGSEISFGLLAIVLLSNTLLSIGTPGVPGGAIASFAALASIAGLPMGIMGVYISINTLCDMGATCCNVLGDLACSVAMKRTIKHSSR
ncbi:dicarboxylate/amino acid:cation symporter [Lacrimispora sp. 210928-DFI.3.58]|uniref:dicarboxylate/amino acid:cation symporter n=1 Tax=Lacrimispora sp. 210928-DFI.3.58 TaxID=2883214 RepID=UPI001D06D86F|nr:dicarboxylate/amino acid:cation symporter [Lacrimispora sp. 210928-DFI.3.58]MCB7320645.1 dicarboxylate/amino acid:cation symporter [Lacrimispora sp. 210928-DFI.3.58]